METPADPAPMGNKDISTIWECNMSVQIQHGQLLQTTLNDLDIVHCPSGLVTVGFVAARRAELIFGLGILARLVDCFLASVFGNVFCVRRLIVYKEATAEDDTYPSPSPRSSWVPASSMPRLRH